MPERHDLLIIGGGVHGAGIARDAAGRGLRVALCESGDFAGATSSASSKLIHGGLRYLEYGDLRLVREALGEREVLLRIAPHISRPMRFVLPHVAHLRPAWMIRIGLLLYDHLASRSTLAGSERVALRRSAYGEPLDPSIETGFVYSDGWIDDSRLVILNLKAAAQRGALILPRSRFVGAQPHDDGWIAHLQGSEGEAIELHASILVNATGPWVDTVRGQLSAALTRRTRLVKGSHLVLPALYEGEHAYILQAEDRRVVFMIPFAGPYTLLGTTDIAVDSPETPAHADAAEIEYLCAAASRFLKTPITPQQVLHSFSGVRALLDDGHRNPSAVSRDFALLMEQVGEARVLSIIGGKLTTYRMLAEHALDKLAPHLSRGLPKAWTADEPLPGGDLQGLSVEGLVQEMSREYPGLPKPLLDAVVKRHGSLARDVLGNAQTETDLGARFGDAVTAREVDYLIEHEWARTAEDVLWRRTKSLLGVTQDERAALQNYIDGRLRARAQQRRPVHR
jgi:glycerol-3-phosphate dehydrogenase